MMSTVTNTQVAVKYRRDVDSLSIDMSANNRTTTLSRHIDRHIGRVSVDISTDAWPICRPIYRATHLGRHIDRHSTDMLTDISVDTRLICRPIRRSTVGRYVDPYVGRGVHKVHMIPALYIQNLRPKCLLNYFTAKARLSIFSSKRYNIQTFFLGSGANMALIFCCLKTSFLSSSLLCNQSGWVQRGTGLLTWTQKRHP